MAGQPAPKRTGPRRSRGESKAALAHTGSKTTVQAAAPEAPGPSGWTPAALKAYLQGVRLEMGRVTWPSARELQAATTVVMVTLILFAGYLGALDFFLKRFFR
ncbi:preprotein translocase subunit SecE [bacterium]|nr:preprotein translocase subunit SecE [bacterium]